MCLVYIDNILGRCKFFKEQNVGLVVSQNINHFLTYKPTLYFLKEHPVNYKSIQ